MQLYPLCAHLEITIPTSRALNYLQQLPKWEEALGRDKEAAEPLRRSARVAGIEVIQKNNHNPTDFRKDTRRDTEAGDVVASSQKEHWCAISSCIQRLTTY